MNNNQLHINHILSLRFADAIVFNLSSSLFLDVKSPGIIALERTHIGGSNHKKKPQLGTYNQINTTKI